MTKIEWVKSEDGSQGRSWNPIVGCSLASPGCTNCYAMKMASRLERIGVTHYAGLTQPSKAGPVWTGKLALAPESVLLAPLKRKKPTTYFVNSMGDVFHEDAPDDWIDLVFAVMALCPQHVFQVLTKRAGRMREYLSKDIEDRLDDICHTLPNALDESWHYPAEWPLPNVWLGVSAEDQKRADERIPHLLQTPTAVRFVSCEPLLGQLDLSRWLAIDWVIVGGESGPCARPMQPDWARSLRDQCAAASVPFFFKQWGEWAPYGRGRFDGSLDAPMQRFGKTLSGNLLDGRTWQEMPR